MSFFIFAFLSLCSSHPEYKSNEFYVPDAQVQFTNYVPSSKDSLSKDNTYLNTVGKIDMQKYATPPNAPPREIKWDYASTDSSLSSDSPTRKGSYKDALQASNNKPKTVTVSKTAASGHTDYKSTVSNISSEAKSIIEDLKSQNESLKANQLKLEKKLTEMNAQYQKNHQDLMSTMKTFTGMAMKQHYTLATPMKKPEDHFTGVSPAADYYDEQIFQMRVIAAQSMG